MDIKKTTLKNKKLMKKLMFYFALLLIPIITIGCNKSVLEYYPMRLKGDEMMNRIYVNLVFEGDKEKIDEDIINEAESNFLLEIPARSCFKINNIEDCKYKILIKLNVLEWNVPDYEVIIGKSIAGGLLGGITGGIIGGVLGGLSSSSSEQTDVYGNCDIKFMLVNVNDTILNENFTYSYKTETSLSECDDNDTKARVMGYALKRVYKKTFHYHPIGIRKS